MTERLVVIGGDAAGMSAAFAARRQLPRDQREIVAFERGHYTSYSACGIPYFIGKEVAEASQLIARTPQQFQDKQDIDARVGHEVLEIDLHGGPCSSATWPPARPALPGIDAQGIHGAQTLDDGLPCGPCWSSSDRAGRWSSAPATSA